jgi:hypothetical protein
MIPDNARPIRLTAAAGTYLAGAYSRGTVIQEALSSSLLLSSDKELYNPKAFIAHAASLRQAFAHCARFLTAASRRSLGRVSVPVWLIILSDQLPIIALVGRYLTNELIGRKPLPGGGAFRSPAFIHSSSRHGAYPVLAVLSNRYPRPRGTLLTCYSPVRRSVRAITRRIQRGFARLACLRRAASVRPEPGSNSPKVIADSVCTES